MKIKHIGMTHVKGTRFLDVPEARLASYGLAGDREFLLVNARGALLGPEEHAAFLPLAFAFDRAQGLMTLRYPDGRAVTAPLQFDARPAAIDYLGMRSIRLLKILGDWDRLLEQFSGKKVALYRCADRGGGTDVKPVTLLTTGSLRLLSEKLGSAVDHRRFRANLVIDNDEPHVEDRWEGGVMSIGAARLRILSSVPRCVVTHLDPDSGREDQPVVRALRHYRARVRMPDGLMPQYATPGFASYAEIISPGHIAVGYPVAIEAASGD